MFRKGGVISNTTVTASVTTKVSRFRGPDWAHCAPEEPLGFGIKRPQCSTRTRSPPSPNLGVMARVRSPGAARPTHDKRWDCPVDLMSGRCTEDLPSNCADLSCTCEALAS